MCIFTAGEGSTYVFDGTLAPNVPNVGIHFINLLIQRDSLMPGYQTHITWSSAAGVGLGCVAKLFYNVSVPQAVFGGVLCALGGVLPDIDSDTSKAYRRCITTISGTCVLLLASRLRDFNLEPEGVVTTCAAVYFFIVYVIGGVVKKMTVHRGMFHSIPFAVIAGELIFILSSGTTQLRLFKAASIVIGVLIHLTLDEINSVSVLDGGGSSSRYRNSNDAYNSYDYNSSKGYGRSYGNRRTSYRRKKRFQIVRIKNSFGTALKLIDYKHMSTTIIFYVVAAFLGHCAMGVQDFLADMGDVDQAEVHGRLAVERIKRIYPKQFDLSVVQWVAENRLVLSPGQEDNEKWRELEELLAIGDEKKDSGSIKKGSQRSKAQDDATEEKVSLLDVINWDSMNNQEKEPSSP